MERLSGPARRLCLPTGRQAEWRSGAVLCYTFFIILQDVSSIKEVFAKRKFG